MVAAIIQARMGSTRLPGKVMLEAAGKTMLWHLINRLRRAETLERTIVATSTAEQDQVIVDFCDLENIPVFRGSETDVLDRYFAAASHYGVDTVVRITSDCPLIDPALIDQMVIFFQEHQTEYDLVTNRHPLTFPDGTDLDIMSFQALKYVWERADKPHQREHTVPYFWEAGMRVFNFEHPDKPFYQHRWTLDYPEDFELISQILTALHREEHCFGTVEIMNLLAQNPQLASINSKYLPERMS